MTPEVQPLNLERAAATVAAEQSTAADYPRQAAQEAWITLHQHLTAHTPRPADPGQAVRS